MNENKPKLWTKNFIAASGINFFLILIFYLLMVTIATFAVKEYGATTSEAGLVTGIFIIGTLIGRLAIGRYIDKIGRTRTLINGLLLFTATRLLSFEHLRTALLLVARLLHAMPLGSAHTSAGT